MLTVVAGQANTVTHDLVAKATGDAITSGVVTFYLWATSGANAGKWWRGSDGTWQADRSSAGAGVYVADAEWSCEIAAAAWGENTDYSFTARESGGLDITHSSSATTRSGGVPVNITVETSAV